MYDCKNKGAVIGSVTIGGFIGDGTNNVLNKIKNIADITGTSQVGGIIGIAASGGEVSECLNSGKIKAQEATGQGSDILNIAGGIVATNSCNIIKSVNLADIEGKIAGGITGVNNSTINCCYNRGKIIGTQYIGGIAGQLNDISIQDNRGISNSYNTGVVSAVGKYGGIIGGVLLNGLDATSIDQSVISNNTYLNTASNVGIANIILAGVNPHSSYYMKSKYFQSDLGNNYEFINGDDYPILSWQEGERKAGADFVEIGNAQELQEFEDIIKVKGEKYIGKTVRLMANISFANNNWTPIGNLFEELGTDGEARFQGTFVGNGKTITVTITDNTTNPPTITTKVYNEANNYKD